MLSVMLQWKDDGVTSHGAKPHTLIFNSIEN